MEGKPQRLPVHQNGAPPDQHRYVRQDGRSRAVRSAAAGAPQPTATSEPKTAARCPACARHALPHHTPSERILSPSRRCRGGWLSNGVDGCPKSPDNLRGRLPGSKLVSEHPRNRVPLGTQGHVSGPTALPQAALPTPWSPRSSRREHHCEISYADPCTRSTTSQDTPHIDSKTPPRYSGGVRVGPRPRWLFSPEYALRVSLEWDAADEDAW